MRRLVGGALALALVALALGCTVPARVAAEEYTLGVEDVVQVSVWLHSELDKSVPVASDGNVVFAPVGPVKAVGLTTKELADRLGDKLSSYLRQTTTVTVTVSQYLSRSVYVVGSVGKPGRYGFETLPGLVDLISQAGGAQPGADLARVQIIRREGEARRVLIADVSSALRDGIGTDLPALKPGDTVVLNSGQGAYTGSPSDAIVVLGEVTRPGLYPAGSGIDLWTVLAQAGGFTPRANLRLVRVLTPGPEGSKVMTFDVLLAMQRPGGKPLILKPGEVVFVQASTPGPVWNTFLQVLAVSRDLLAIAIAVDILRRYNNGSN